MSDDTQAELAGLKVELEHDATPAEIAAVQQVLDEFGLPAKAEPTLVVEGRGGPDEIPIAIQIAVGYGSIRFLDAFLAEAAREAWSGVRRLVRRLRARRHGRSYQVVLRDSVADLEIWIDDDLPDRAFEALKEIDLGSLGRGSLYFSEGDGEWVFHAEPPD